MSVVPIPDNLRQMPLFRGLTQSELERLCQLLRSKMVATGKPVITVSDGEESGEVAYGVTYVIRQGLVKVLVEEPLHATPVVLALLGPGQIIGEMSLVSQVGYSATVITMEETSLYWIEHAVLRECLRTMPDLAYNLIGVLSDRMRHANAQIQSLATLTIRKRVASQIIGLAKEHSQSTQDGYRRIPIRLTNTALAELVGATSVSVYNVLTAFKNSSYIAIDQDHCITVLDPNGLINVLSESSTRGPSGKL